jgi:SAM-dependent methyltransferase
MFLRMLGSVFNGKARARHEPADDTAPLRGPASGTSRLSRAPFVESRCKICEGPASRFDVVDFNKHCGETNPYEYGLAGLPVYYSRCGDCGFIFTRHFDDWDNARFARDIYNEDYVKVDPEYASTRPLRAAEHFAAVFPETCALSILDYGAGSGVFARRLSELGFTRVESFDPYSNPGRPAGVFDLITCVEVMEHAPDPHATLRDMLSFAHAKTRIVFTTVTQPDNIAAVRAAWWYVAPRNGHVSIHSDRSLHALAAAHGLSFSRGDAFHVFGRDCVEFTMSGAFDDKPVD